MRIGYRVLKSIIKFYDEDRRVYTYCNFGNKKVKLERIFRFRYCSSINIISKERFKELEREMKWFEIKE